MRYFEKNSKKEKDKEYQITAKSFFPAIAAGVGSGAAFKAVSDLERIDSKIKGWEQSMDQLAKIAPDRPNSFPEADEAFRKYIEGGTDVSKTKVLGIRSGRFFQHGNKAIVGGHQKIQDLMSKVDKSIPKVPEGQKHELSKVVEHYKVYTDDLEYSKLKDHMIEKALGSRDMNSALKNPAILNPTTEKIIFNTKEYPTFEQQYSKLKQVNPEAAKVFQESILGNPSKGMIGESKRLTGNLKEIVSTPYVYRNRISEFLPPILAGKEILKKYTFPAVATLTALPVAHKVFEKLSEKNKKDDSLKNTLVGAATVPSTIVGGVGVKKLISPSKDIAITYGTMPLIGMGHSSPGKSIKSIIEEDPRFSKAKVDLLERDQHSIYRYSPKKYSLLIDTGLGAEANVWSDPVKTTHNYNLTNKVNTEKKTRYLTDMLSKDNGFGTNIKVKEEGAILAYGENQNRLIKERQVKKVHNISSGPTPAIDFKTVEDWRNPANKKDIVESLLDIEKTVLNTSKNSDEIQLAQKNIQRLTDLKGKSLITIAGAGRGDYVASRSVEMVNALKASGLDKKFGVLPLMAGAKGGPTERLIDAANLPIIGKVDRSLYGQAQRSSIVNWGATGNSGLAESLTFPNIQALPKKWGMTTEANPWKEIITPDSIAERQDKLLNFKGPHAALDEWNAGNIDYALKQKGVIQANTAEDIVNVLKDDSRLKALSTEAGPRADQHFEGLKSGRESFKNILHKEWKSGINRQRLKGTGLAALGLGTLAYSGKYLYDKMNKNK